MRVYLRQEDGEAALADVEHLIEHQPNEPILFAMRGLAKAMAGDGPGAAADFDRAQAMTDDPELLSVIELIRTETGY